MASKQQSRRVWVLVFIVFIGFIGISMPYLIFPALFLNPAYSILPLDTDATGKALFLGLTLAAYPLGQFIGSPVLGALSDDYGRKRLLTASLVVSAICSLFTGIAIAWKQLALLIASRFGAGLMEGNIAIARAMAADMKEMSKHETIGKVNASVSIAYLLGPLIGGVLSDGEVWQALTASTPFYCICVLFLGCAALSARVLEETAVTAPNLVQTFWQRINFLKRMLILFANKQLQFLMIVCTTFTLAVDIFYEFAPVYLTVKWTLGPAKLAFYNAVLCLTLGVGNGWLAGFFASRISSRLSIASALGGFALFLLGIVLAQSTILMFVLFALSGFAIGFTITTLTVKISDAVSDTIQGEVMGVQLSLRVLGDGLICLFGSALLLMSPTVILVVASALCLFITLYYALRQGAFEQIT